MVLPQRQSLDAAPDFFIRNRACPICNAAEASMLGVKAQLPAETLSEAEIGKYWRGFFDISSFFTYHRCDKCGQLYSPIYLSDNALGQLYASMDSNIHSGDEALSYKTQQSYVNILMKRATCAERYLEIGPDTGLFAKALQEKLNVQSAYLAEPNRAVWQELVSVFKPKTTTLVSNVFDLDRNIPDSSLDLAVSVHVLDHIAEPSKVVRWVASKLIANGVAAFVVHNERSLLARILGNRWPAYCLQHPQLYNPATLKTLLEVNGFRDVVVHPTVNYFPLGYLLSHGLYAVLRLRINLDFLTWPVKLRLGNIMAVATKKS